MQNCTKATQPLQLIFDISGVKKVEGAFDAAEISSDGGLILVCEADNKLQLSEQVALRLNDSREEGKVIFSLVDMIKQRLYMIATGHEDLNDADYLFNDRMHKLCNGQNPETGRNLASDSTLQRLENDRTQEELDKLQELLVYLFIHHQTRVPYHITLDIDGTCDETHGNQQLSFYNGYYQTSCFIPLFVFVGSFPVAAILRSGKAGPAEGTVEVLTRIVRILRKAYPKTRIYLRADAGFDEPAIYEYCERTNITYYIGLPSNSRLEKKSEHLQGMTKRKFLDEFKKEQPENDEMTRVIQDVAYAAESWTVWRRVIARCDYKASGFEFRYIVTNDRGGRAQWLYEDRYCKRARCENYIKELKSVRCDRLSSQEFTANQFRLLLHTFAYILLLVVRNAGPASERHISVESLMLRIIKVGVQIRETARRIYLSWTSSHPWQEAFAYTHARLIS